MRAPILALLIALCGCPSSLDSRLAANEDSDGTGGGSGSGGAGGASPTNCVFDQDCVEAAPKCCDCPTHAVPVNDPSQTACFDVNCGPMQCGDIPLQAACNGGHCELECAPTACDPSISCPSGFVTDGNGCLTCQCAGTADVGGECTVDNQCARVRDDCCGCLNGGFDTAVPAGQAQAHDAALMCPSNPTCPGGDTCAPDLAARCVQGTCSLVAGPIPANACGRADLPACPSGEVCYVNANDQATMHGVGVCQP